MKFLKARNGFTLLESMLYIAIAAVVVMASTFFFFFLLESRIKNQTISEVEQQGAKVMRLMTQTLRNASAINLPGEGTHGTTLSLGTYSGTTTPTVFTVSSGVIRVQEASGTVVALTNSRISASDLSFHNVSRPGTPGIVRIEFTLTHINNTGRSEYAYSKTFVSSATLRQP